MTIFLAKTKNKSSKRIGRGGKRGKTAGRGTKGQKARAGHRIRPHIRDIIKKLPKLRGRGKNINKAFRTKPEIVNLTVLEKAFSSGEQVTLQTLVAKGAVSPVRSGKTIVKVLGNGTITKPLSIVGLYVSTAAKEKIVAAGGSIK